MTGPIRPVKLITMMPLLIYSMSDYLCKTFIAKTRFSRENVIVVNERLADRQEQ